MMIDNKNNHPLNNVPYDFDREDIDELMRSFLPKVKDLGKKINREKQSTQEKISSLIEYNT